MSGLGDVFRGAVELYSGRPALWVEGETYTYEQLFDEASRIARSVEGDEPNPVRQPLAVLAQRSLPAYAGVLAAALSGRAYVPLNPRFPHERNLQIAKLASVSAIVADARTAEAAALLRDDLAGRVAVAVPGLKPLPAILQPEEVIGSESAVEAGATAYIMFTSGTTGAPKGVRVLNSNVCHYLDAIRKIAPLTSQDRCTQLFDFSFDLSVHDLFVTWSSGACLFTLPRDADLAMIEFVRKHDLTSWFSVPAAASIAQRLKQLRADAMPSLRLSLFCGEALPVNTARAWSTAAPNSALLNLYGPTEATIAITSYQYSPDIDLSAHRAVPIGLPFAGQETAVLDPDGREVALGETGELHLGGTQVTGGYINNATANREKFLMMEIAGKVSKRWYKTGDVCKVDSELGLIFLGRADDQLKINGHRVELMEVEEGLRRVAGTNVAAVVPWPVDANGAVQGLMGFACGSALLEQDILAAMAARLPPYMVPRRIIVLDVMPLTTSGKIDRQKLRIFCEPSKTPAP